MSNYGSNDPNQPRAGQGDAYGQQPGQYGQGQPQYGQQADQYGQQSGQYGAGGYNPMPGTAGPVGTPPPNNLALAIITTVLCCLPLGIVAIIQATKVNSLWQAGDQAGAREASDKAKKFSIWGIAIGIPLLILSVVLQLMVLNSNGS